MASGSSRTPSNMVGGVGEPVVWPQTSHSGSTSSGMTALIAQQHHQQRHQLIMPPSGNVNNATSAVGPFSVASPATSSPVSAPFSNVGPAGWMDSQTAHQQFTQQQVVQMQNQMFLQQQQQRNPHHQTEVINDIPLLERKWDNKQQWPAEMITPDNAMRYFCHPANPFFDTQSDNNVLMMQQQGVTAAGTSALDDPVTWKRIEEKMTQMTGDQYTLVEAMAPLYVVRKHKRHNPQTITPLAYYYILDGDIYQAPDLYTVVQSRLVGAMEPLYRVIKSAAECLRFNPTQSHPYTWQFKTIPAQQSESAREQKAASTLARLEKRQEQQHSGTKSMENDDGLAMPQQQNQKHGISDKKKQKPQQWRTTTYQCQRTDVLLRALVEQFPPIELKIGACASAGSKSAGGGSARTTERKRAATTSTVPHDSNASDLGSGISRGQNESEKKDIGLGF